MTPPEVSELLARIAVSGKTEANKVYDPVLKFAKVLGAGQSAARLLRTGSQPDDLQPVPINMFLHDVNYEKFDIAHGDTLTDPAHWDDEPFEAIISNPP